MPVGRATLQEIFNQPQVWRNCLNHLAADDVSKLVKKPRSHQWIFIGCGTSYYLAQAAAASFTELTGCFARAVPASEHLFYPNLVIPQAAEQVFPVLISRSGHTSEVLRVAEDLRQRGIEFLAVTCDGNELAQLTERTVALPVVEESTVMTSSFTSMLMALQYIAAVLAERSDLIRALHDLPVEVEDLLGVYAPQIEDFARDSFEGAAFLGQGPFYSIAAESSLKVMESSSTYAQCFHTLEFRHGPKSIVTEDVLVTALLSEAGYAEESAVLTEMKDLGARTLAIANCITPAVRSSADLAIELALPVPELARLVVYLVWGQLLGAYAGLRKGLNPDAPRNLTRVVTLAGEREE